MGKKRIFRIYAPGKALFSYLSTGAIAKGIGILTTPLFTRLLGVEDYGRVALYLGAVGIVSGIVSPFVSGGQIYRVIGKYKDNAVFFSGLPYIFVTALVLCTLLFTFKEYFEIDVIFVVMLYTSYTFLRDAIKNRA